jgi:arylsulfatase A-like enzyme
MSPNHSRRAFLKAVGLLPLALLADRAQVATGAARSVQPDKSGANVLIILFDALSANHMSLYGYHRPTTPHLARFAERATVFHRHYAAGNFTSPGTASLLTGTYPWSHRSLHLGAKTVQAYEQQNLFQVLGTAGYTRVAYTHNRFADVFLHQFRQNLDLHIPMEAFCAFDSRLESRLVPDDPYLSALAFEDMTLDQYEMPGSLFLSEFDDAGRRILDKVLMRQQPGRYPLGTPFTHGKLYYYLENAIDALEESLIDTHQPFLGYFHFYPPHYPYRTREDFVGLFDDGWMPVAKDPHFFSDGVSELQLSELRRAYDEFVAYADSEFGRLYDLMVRTGMLDNTYVIVTADHGELFERGVWEHLTPLLYEPLIHIPLLIAKPDQQQREDVDAPTSCVDLLPTLLQITGQAVPDWCEGSILPTFGGQEGDLGRSIYSVEAKVNPKHEPLNKGTIAMVKNQHKLIHYLGYDGYDSEYELYDVVNDPEELEDLFPRGDPIAAVLKTELEETLRMANESYRAGRL